MSETKFTKGEWKVYEYKAPHFNNPDLQHVTIHYGDNDEHIVDTVYELADAHLIAAAPEMYEMLLKQSELMVFLDEQTHPNIELDAVKHAIDKLLEKARGEHE